MWIASILMATAGTVVLVVAVLGASGRLPFGSVAGVSRPVTLASAEAWRAAHRALAPWLCAVAADAYILAVAAALWSSEPWFWPLWVLLIADVPVLIVVGTRLAIRAARRLDG